MLTTEQKRSLERERIEWRRLDVVSAEAAIASVARGEGTIVDNRHAGPFEEGHFRGAVNLREEEDLLTLPRDREIFTYCT